MAIRPYKAEDAAAVRDCIVALQEFERGLDSRMRPGAEIAERYLADLLARCAREEGRIIIAEVEGAVAGFAAVFPKVASDEPDERDYDYAYVSDVAVLDRYRRRGLGRSLLQAAEGYARKRGAKWLRIGALAANRGARNLYESHGFRNREVLLEKPLTG